MLLFNSSALWKVWISYPQCVWITFGDPGRFVWEVLLGEGMWKNRLTYPQRLWIKIQYLSPAFVDIVESVDNLSTKIVDNFLCRGSLWKVWITFPQCVWISDDCQYMPIWLWKVWITFPQFLWKSRFHRFFTPGMWITLCAERENALSGVGVEEGVGVDEKRAGGFLAHGVIHNFCG